MVRERAITGNPAAIPKTISLQDGESLGVSRSAPSSLPGVQEVYLAVEACLRPSERILRMALEAKFAFGVREVPVRYVYHWEDELEPTVVAALEQAPYEPAEPEPLNYVRRDVEYRQEFDLAAGYQAVRSRCLVPDWELLHAAAVSMGCGPVTLLGTVAGRFAKKTLIDRAGL